MVLTVLKKIAATTATTTGIVTTELASVTADTLVIYVNTGHAVMNVVSKVSARRMGLANVTKATLDLIVRFLTV
jgi:hypothetical protein